MSITLWVTTVDLSTATGAKLDAAVGGDTFTWYIAMMNGAIYGQGSSDIATDYGSRYFDFVEGVVTFTTTEGTPDTLEARWANFDANTDITDKHCVDALGATCTNDVDATGGTSDYLHSPSESSSYELCTMIWEFSSDNSKQCMQL